MDSRKLKKGDKISRISYMTVIEVNDYYIRVENENKKQWDIGHDILDHEVCNSATQFEKEEKVTRTEIVEIVRTASHDVCSIHFNKQLKPEDFIKLLRVDGGKIRSNAELEKDFKKVKGEERLMICRLTGIPDKFGRFQVVDLEETLDKTKSYDNRIKQVDQQTIQWVILKGVKYIVR